MFLNSFILTFINVKSIYFIYLCWRFRILHVSGNYFNLVNLKCLFVTLNISN